MQNTPSRTAGSARFPRAVTPSLVTIRSTFLSPMNTMKHPTPATTACLRVFAMLSASLSLRPVRVMTRKTIPAMNVATRACCHVNPRAATMM